MNTFLSTHRLYTAGRAIVDGQSDLPADLKAMLKQVGTSTYADGFFRFVSPPAFRQYFER